MIILKNKDEIKIMKEGGKILKRIFKEVRLNIKPEITTKDIEEIAKKLFKKEKVKSSFLNYHKYPGAICISINDEIVHGIPNRNIKINNGDIVSIDIGIKYKNFHVDSAETIPVGKVSPNHKKLISITKKALKEAILQVKPNNYLSNIGAKIQEIIEKAGFQVVKECSGHGIGRNLHEDPTVLNFGKRGEGLILKPGMTFAIEPMAVEGKAIAKIEPDGWTISTVDGSYAAHFEHTVVVTEKGCQILS